MRQNNFSQFNVQETILSANNTTFEINLKFCLNYLSISEFLCINLDIDFTKQRTDVLFNILINVGNKIPEIRLRNFELTQLYDLIIEVNCLKLLKNKFKFSI